MPKVIKDRYIKELKDSKTGRAGKIKKGQKVKGLKRDEMNK